MSIRLWTKEMCRVRVFQKGSLWDVGKQAAATFDTLVWEGIPHLLAYYNTLEMWDIRHPPGSDADRMIFKVLKDYSNKREKQGKKPQ